MSAALIVLATAAYLFLGGLGGFATRLRLMSKCSDCSSREGWSCYDGHQFAFPTVVGALWPFAIPVLGGAYIAHRVTTADQRAVRREKQKQADHERKMAELEAQRALTMDSVKFLMENGIKADVPGLFDVKGKP